MCVQDGGTCWLRALSAGWQPNRCTGPGSPLTASRLPASLSRVRSRLWRQAGAARGQCDAPAEPRGLPGLPGAAAGHLPAPRRKGALAGVREGKQRGREYQPRVAPCMDARAWGGHGVSWPAFCTGTSLTNPLRALPPAPARLRDARLPARLAGQPAAPHLPPVRASCRCLLAPCIAQSRLLGRRCTALAPCISPHFTRAQPSPLPQAHPGVHLHHLLHACQAGRWAGRRPTDDARC